jgi:hypothetical protein
VFVCVSVSFFSVWGSNSRNEEAQRIAGLLRGDAKGTGLYKSL